MKRLLLLLWIFPSAAFGQPTSSPALDKDYVVLKVLEQHKGYYASEAVGGVIKSMGIMRPQDEYSVVFLNNVDTSDPVTRGDAQAFGAGPFFSLRNKPEFSIATFFKYKRVNYKASGIPDLIAPETLLLSRGPGEYNWVDRITLWTHFQGSLDTATLEAAFEALPLRGSERETVLGIGVATKFWDHQRKPQISIFPNAFPKIDTSRYFGERILLSEADYSFEAAKGYSPKGYGAKVLDLNHDSIADIVTRVDSGIQCFMGEQATVWALDSTFVVSLTYQPVTILSFDFLYNDGIPDLIIGSADTIYCYDGRDLPSISKRGKMPEAALKIPSPAKLDPLNFEGGINNQGKPLGELDWGEYLFDAGNLNGSGAHSLGVEALYYWRSSSLGHLAYFFLYSGGPAADEKVDAIFEDHTNPIYCGFTTFDTVQQGPGKPCNALVGDFGFNAGGSGSIWYLEGSKTIPHKPDPRWISGVQAADLSQAALILTPEGENIHISIGSPATSVRVRIFNLLGQQISDQDFYGTDMQFPSPLGSGTYICEVQTPTQVFRKSFTVLH